MAFEAFNNITSVYSFFITVNNLSSGIFAMLLLLGFGVIFFRAVQSKFEILNSLVFTFLFLTFISIFLGLLNLIDIRVSFLLAMITSIIVAFAYFKQQY